MPAFAAPYAAEPVLPAKPLPDETLMIEPLPCSSMCGSTARQHRNWLVRHVRIVQSHASKLVPRRSVAASGWTAYALLCSACTVPKRATAASTRRVHVGFHREVDRVRERGATRSLDLFGDRGRAVLVEIRGDHRRPERGAAGRARAPHPRRRAGDDDHLVA